MAHVSTESYTSEVLDLGYNVGLLKEREMMNNKYKKRRRK